MSVYTPQARSAPCPIFSKPKKESFPYGWRDVITKTPLGELIYDQVPAKDFLNPQLGDRMVQNSQHLDSRTDIYNLFKTRYEKDSTTRVFADLKMIWGRLGLKEPAPDVAIVKNIKNKEDKRSSFNVVNEGTRPCLVIEIISPDYPGDDTDKVKIYEQAGIEEYIIIHPHSEKARPFYEICGYRLKGGQYQQIKPDKSGRLFSQSTEVLFGVYNKGRRLRVKDTKTGKWLLTAQESEQKRLKAEKQFKAEAFARQKEALARQEAEALAQLEILARQKEALVRQEAEKRVKEAEKQLRALEKRLREEAKARALLEKRFKNE
jgi:Uma2 family endonuclease